MAACGHIIGHSRKFQALFSQPGTSLCVKQDDTGLPNKVCPRLRDSACWCSGKITQPRTSLIREPCMVLSLAYFKPVKISRITRNSRIQRRHSYQKSRIDKQQSVAKLNNHKPTNPTRSARAVNTSQKIFANPSSSKKIASHEKRGTTVGVT